jgi:hypothetical protein
LGLSLGLAKISRSLSRWISDGGSSGTWKNFGPLSWWCLMRGGEGLEKISGSFSFIGEGISGRGSLKFRRISGVFCRQAL